MIHLLWYNHVEGVIKINHMAKAQKANVFNILLLLVQLNKDVLCTQAAVHRSLSGNLLEHHANGIDEEDKLALS